MDVSIYIALYVFIYLQERHQLFFLDAVALIGAVAAVRLPQLAHGQGRDVGELSRRLRGGRD